MFKFSVIEGKSLQAKRYAKDVSLEVYIEKE